MVFNVFLAIVAGLMAIALIALFVTMIVLAVRSRSHASRATYRR